MQLTATFSGSSVLQERRVAKRHHMHHAASRHLSSVGLPAASGQQPAAVVPWATCLTSRTRISASRSVQSAAARVPDVLDTVVVGAGISGLVTAQALATKHSDKVQSFLVTEGRERVGGNITSMQGDGYIWEEGPNSFQPNDAMLQAAVSACCCCLKPADTALQFTL